MSEGSDYERGRAAARLDMNDERHLENKGRLDTIEAKLDELNQTLTMVKGGARMLYAVGLVAAGIGAAVSQMFHWFEGHIK